MNIQDIVKNDLCTGCGICVSEEKENTLRMEWDDYGFLTPQSMKNSISSDSIKVCPFNPNPEKEVEDEDKLADIFLETANKKNDRIGKFVNTYVGYSKEYRETSSSGGIATYVFEQLLKQKIVDHLYIVKEVNGTYEYQLFSNVKQIKEISKTRYLPVTLEKLFLTIDDIEGKIAISGVACFIKAIRLKQYYNPELKSKIPFLIGIICGGLKSRFFTDYLAQKAGIEGEYSKQDYRIKNPESVALDYSFGAFDGKNEYFHQVKMKTVGDTWGSGLFKSNACDFCDDVATELADISLGDAWIDPYFKEGLGNSVIVTRSELAEQLILEGISKDMLSVEILNVNSFITSQKGSFNHRQDGLKYRIQNKKKEGKLIPKKRCRFLINIPFYFKFVQKQRMITRDSSLKLWYKTKNLRDFETFLDPIRNKLAKKTLLYHRFNRLRNKLFR